MPSLLSFVDMVDKLRKFLKLRSDRLEAEKEQVNEALTAVNRAANHTRGYLADLRNNPNNRNRQKELVLSDAWVEVGERLCRINDPAAQELYDRCFIKARYWSDPEGYDISGDQDVDIRLDSVLKDVETICLRVNDN